MLPRKTWLYDEAETYEYNLEHGPYTELVGSPYINEGEPEYDFFGTKVYLPFGISAGPLPKAHFIPPVLAKGFDVVTFKSVRTSTYPCHPAPNVMPVDLGALDPTDTNKEVFAKHAYTFPLSLANSYGIPSLDPAEWQVEIRKALSSIGKGQALMAAFQGTERGEGHEAFINDHARGVKLLAETGVDVIEINLSCPNEGSPRLLCYDTHTVKEILHTVREAVGDIKLVVKLTYFNDVNQLRNFVRDIGPLVEGISAINTIGARVVDTKANQAFPGGAPRAKPGISGHAIRPLALDMVSRLNLHRHEFGLKYKIIGIGGVQKPRDYYDYISRGADVVMALTGPMWNPDLAAEIKASSFDFSQ